MDARSRQSRQRRDKGRYKIVGYPDLFNLSMDRSLVEPRLESDRMDPFRPEAWASPPPAGPGVRNKASSTPCSRIIWRPSWSASRNAIGRFRALSSVSFDPSSNAAGPSRFLRAGPPGAVLLQGPRVLPVLRRPTDDRHRGTPGGARVPRSARPAVGPLASLCLTLPPGLRQVPGPGCPPDLRARRLQHVATPASGTRRDSGRAMRRRHVCPAFRRQPE